MFIQEVLIENTSLQLKIVNFLLIHEIHIV